MDNLRALMQLSAHVCLDQVRGLKVVVIVFLFSLQVLFRFRFLSFRVGFVV